MKAIAIITVKRSGLFAVAVAAVAVSSAFSPRISKLSQFSVSSGLLPRSIVAPYGFMVIQSRLFDGKAQSIETDDGESLLGPVITAAQEKLNKKSKALALGRSFVKSIMENEYELIPESDGMSVLRNIVMLETGKTQDLVLRNITIPFWQKCLDIVDTPGMQHRVAAIGASGIGKTTTTPILIQMILKENKTVVYLVRMHKETGWYYEFVPGPNNSIVTKVYPESIQRNEIPSLLVKSTYYIVDSGSTIDDCNPPSNFEPKVILVPSQGSGHWGGSAFEIGQGGVRGFLKIMPLWTLEELLSAQPILCPDLIVGVVRDMYRLFGGVPRDVFGNYSEALILEKIESMQKISFFDKGDKERKAILERMICAYLHEKPKLQADFPISSHCYKIDEAFSTADSYWITKLQFERFEETFNRGILYRPDIVDELMQLIDTTLKPKKGGKGIMIKGPHGIGKSHSIINVVRNLLYNSDDKYLVTFVPNCDEWLDIEDFYDAICSSFGTTTKDFGFKSTGTGLKEERKLFNTFVEAIDEILTEKGMKWIFIFDHINKLFDRPVLKELKDVSAMPFPFNTIKSVMKGGHITTIISTSVNNDISYRESHPGFVEYEHCCIMKTVEVNAAFQEVAKLKGIKKKKMVHELTGGVPLQLANLINFNFSIKDYQDDAMEYILDSLQKLWKESDTEDFASITQAAVACLLFLNGSRKHHDCKYSIQSKCGGGTCYKPLFPMVLVAYRQFFWDALIMFIKEKEKVLLSVCRDKMVTAEVCGQLFEYMVINRCSSNANVTIDVDWEFPMLQNCNLVNAFEEQTLPDIEENGMYVPKRSNFPAVDLIWKCEKSVCGVQVHIASHKDTLEQFEALCTNAGWFEKFENVYMLYLSPTTDVAAKMQKYISKWQGGRIQVAAVSVDKIACLADLQW